MIDIHSHILPDLDDGPGSLEESIAMIRMAAENGTTSMAATPHANLMYQYDERLVRELLAQLQALAPTGFILYQGADFHLMHDNIVDAVSSPAKYALNGKNYLLVELSDLVIFPNTSDLYQSLEDVGLKLVITHPERNRILQQKPHLIEEWAGQGRLMQVTAGSLFGRFGKRASDLANRMLKQGLVHFIASDAHDTTHRPPRLDLAHEYVKQRYSLELADILCIDHPRAAVEGRPIDLVAFAATMRSQKEKPWWSRLFTS